MDNFETDKYLLENILIFSDLANSNQFCLVIILSFRINQL